MKNRVNPAGITKVQAAGKEYWLVPKGSDIRPCAILLKAVPSFTDREVEEARGFFQKFDEDASGAISPGQLFKLMNYLNPGYTKKRLEVKVARLLSRIDAEGDGQLSFNEFKTWFILQQRTLCELRAAGLLSIDW